MSSKDINTSGKQSSGPAKGKGDERKARLSQALRDNLKRRKAQTRARRTESAPQAPTSEGSED